ncbi:MAG: helix-turn-helix domain-containing protein [Thermoplasmata archaeon]
MVTPSRGEYRPVDPALNSQFLTPNWNPSDTSTRDSAPGAGRIPWPSHRGPGGLQGFGLSSREARVYLALITLGPSGARRATEGSGLHRATAYRVLSRLVARGLVTSDRRWPREYHPLPLRVLVERNVAFLRDEIELRHWLLRAFASTPEPTNGGHLVGRPDPGRNPPSGAPERGTEVPIGMTTIGSATDSPLIRYLQGARREVNALIRPLMIPAGLRAKVGASLARASARGLHVRVVLDYFAADLRFAAQLHRERTTRGPNLEVRHFTPLGGHVYVVDGQAALRFPTLSGSSRDPDFGFLSADPDFVRSQAARFDAVWDDAVARKGSRPPTAPGAPATAGYSPVPSRTGPPTVGEVRSVPFNGMAGRVGSR